MDQVIDDLKEAHKFTELRLFFLEWGQGKTHPGAAVALLARVPV